MLDWPARALVASLGVAIGMAPAHADVVGRQCCCEQHLGLQGILSYFRAALPLFPFTFNHLVGPLLSTAVRAFALGACSVLGMQS